MLPDDLLRFLANGLGLDALALNDDGVLGLAFEDTILVQLEPDPAHRQCLLYAALCPAPSDPDARRRLFEILLAANTFGHGSAGHVFCLDHASDDLLLARTFDPESVPPEQVLDWIRELVLMIDGWRSRLPEILVGERFESLGPRDGDLLIPV